MSASTDLIITFHFAFSFPLKGFGSTKAKDYCLALETLKQIVKRL